MTLSRLVFSSMKRNIKQYGLYFFALIFSVTLCFSFITLQYNSEVLGEVNSPLTKAGFKAATYVLYFIVVCFVLYANSLFIKRRNKEIGLYQLIGMTKNLIVRLIAFESVLLFITAVVIGMFTGFLASRLFAMILLKLLGQSFVIDLVFSFEAVKQTAILFGVLLVVVVVQLAIMVHRSTLLTLFTATKKADERIKKFSVMQMVLGVLGVALISFGYYRSTILLVPENMNEHLILYMVIILASTIGGTYLVFRYSVALFMNMLRTRRNGHLSLTDVLAVTPLMHRMKENASSLTIIATLTGLSVGISGLSYITYYSSEEAAKMNSPYEYTLVNDQGTVFLDELDRNNIAYTTDDLHFTAIVGDGAGLVPEHMTASDETTVEFYALGLSEYEKFHKAPQLQNDEFIITGYTKFQKSMTPYKEDGSVKLEATGETLKIKELNDNSLIPSMRAFNRNVIIVTDEQYAKLAPLQPAEQVVTKLTAITLKDNAQRDKAEALYEQTLPERAIDSSPNPFKEGDKLYVAPDSYQQSLANGMESGGMVIFITSFLGLTLLMTTGSILYFKQMAEADDEKASYTTLRKIGFTTEDIMSGIYMKQLFNFGVPLLIGLLHSYFAVKSGWFLFGAEMVTPFVITVSLYTVVYILFALVTVGYYRKIVKASL